MWITSWVLGTALAMWGFVLQPPLFKVLFFTASIKVPLIDINALALPGFPEFQSLWFSFCFPSSAVTAYKGMATVTALKASKE